MEQIGKSAGKAIEASHRESSQRVATTAAFVKYTVDNLPLAFNHACDVALPAKLWSPWHEQGKPRTIRRALFAEEEVLLRRRVNELEPVLAPFRRPQEDERVQAAVDELFASYSSMRLSGEAYLAKIHGFVMMLADMPAWAIEEACLKVRKVGYQVETTDGRKRLEQTFAPSEAQLYAAVEKVIEQRESALRSARALLAAPAEPKPIEVEGRPVDEVIAEFKAKMNPNADAIEQAEEQRRKTFSEAQRRRNIEERRKEYLAAGLDAPKGDMFASLSMMFKMGWTIVDPGNGSRMLVAPSKREGEI